MNQILVINNNFFNAAYLKFKKKYLILFFISISICFILSFYLFYSLFYKTNNEKVTNLLKNKYNINTLYNSTSNYATLKISNNISIIGLVDIPKINISYPIINNTSKELLKISVCRFSGPLPNRIGNLCIVGHNYKNSTMFSKLDKLKIGDSIYITDLNNTRLEYSIYNILTVEENNLNCIKNSKQVEITLITCNTNDNSKRTVLKAKMKG